MMGTDEALFQCMNRMAERYSAAQNEAWFCSCGMDFFDEANYEKHHLGGEHTRRLNEQ